MANLTVTPAWEENIYQLSESDPVLGGEEGISNVQAQQLANRTAWLKQQLESSLHTIEENLSVTVGAGGDYANLLDAIIAISKKWPIFVNNGLTVEVVLLTGYVINQQIVISGLDLSFIHIRPELPETVVVVNESGFTASAIPDFSTNKVFMSGINKAALPSISGKYSSSANQAVFIAVDGASSARFNGEINGFWGGLWAVGASTIHIDSTSHIASERAISAYKGAKVWCNHALTITAHFIGAHVLASDLASVYLSHLIIYGINALGGDLLANGADITVTKLTLMKRVITAITLYNTITVDHSGNVIVYELEFDDEFEGLSGVGTLIRSVAGGHAAVRVTKAQSNVEFNYLVHCESSSNGARIELHDDSSTKLPVSGTQIEIDGVGNMVTVVGSTAAANISDNALTAAGILFR